MRKFSVSMVITSMLFSASAIAKECNPSATQFKEQHEFNLCELGTMLGTDPSKETVAAYATRVDADDSKFCDKLDNGQTQAQLAGSYPVLGAVELLNKCRADFFVRKKCNGC